MEAAASGQEGKSAETTAEPGVYVPPSPSLVQQVIATKGGRQPAALPRTKGKSRKRKAASTSQLDVISLAKKIIGRSYDDLPRLNPIDSSEKETSPASSSSSSSQSATDSTLKLSLIHI